MKVVGLTLTALLIATPALPASKLQILEKLCLAGDDYACDKADKLAAQEETAKPPFKGDWGTATQILNKWPDMYQACSPQEADINYEACDKLVPLILALDKNGFCYDGTSQIPGWYACRYRGENPQAWIEREKGLDILRRMTTDNAVGDAQDVLRRKLENANWCWGRTNQPAALAKWERCNSMSQHMN